MNKFSARAGAVLAAAAAALVVPVAAASANSQDDTWMVVAHQSNLAEIAAGKSAQANATRGDVKDLGKMLVTDHTKLDASLKKLASKQGLDLPSQPTASQRAALATVKQNSGAAYDAAWVRAQTTGHLQTRAATRKELANGGVPAVLAAAKTATPVVQHHIDELRSIAIDLGISVPNSVSAGTGGQAATGGSALPVTLAGLGLALVGSALLLRRRRAALPV